ncbi:MAG: hypothetical protein QM739_07670 [Propionivibrio sp.]
MKKKKLEKMLRRAMKDRDSAPAWNDAAQSGNGFGADGDWNGKGFGTGDYLNKGLLSGLGLPRGFASGQTEQFILGALLGAAGAYVFANEEMRNRIVKTAMKLYAGLTGGIEEFKEQMADLKAEVESEQGL